MEIAIRILDRGNCSYSGDALNAISATVLVSNIEKIDQLRQENGFDETVGDFCKGIGIENTYGIVFNYARNAIIILQDTSAPLPDKVDLLPPFC